MRIRLPGFITPVHQRVVLVAAFLAALVCAAGCRQKSPTSVRVPTYPVHGRLTIDGAPAPGAMVKFMSAEHVRRVPTAIVREDGSFSVSFYDNEDGAPAGEYKLLVAWMQTPPQGGLAQDRLGGRFLEPSKPVATVVVSAGQNNLEPIELSMDKAGQPSPPR
jgi:hypothetical protein